MFTSLKSYLPQGLMGRSLMIVVVPVIIIQIAAAIFFFDNHWEKMTERLAYGLAGEIAIAADQIENNYSQENFETLSTYLSRHLDMLIAFQRGAELPPEKDHSFIDGLVIAPLVTALEEQVGRPFIICLDLDEKWVEVKVQLDNGVLTALSAERRLFSSSGYLFILFLFGTTFVLLLVAVLFMRNQVRPIRKLAIAARRLGMGRDLPPSFKPSGAREVRQAAEAFETMNRRIRRHVEQRTAMLAGVSHDLRTPLTRLKLQLSMLEGEGEEVEDMRKDLQDMEHMINAYLDFTRGQQHETAQIVELKDFIEDIVAGFGHEKANIEIHDLNHPVLGVQPVNLRRCLENILSNACRYGDHVLITLNEASSERVYIMIEDNGPGIPEDKYEDALKAFVRLDPSRSQSTGGVGLGLSVALDIMLAHGGKLRLGRSDKLGGLKITLSFPK